MKKVLILTLLILFTCLLLFSYFNKLQASSEESAKLKAAWLKVETAIAEANRKMEEIKIARERYQTEQDTLMSDAPSTVLGMIGKGFSVVLNIFFNSSKGVRIIELDALIMYTWIQADILNVELSTLDAERDVALAAYNASGSHNASEINQPDYETIPIVSVPCPNMCGATFTSTDAGGLRNLKDYMESAHRDMCGNSSATPPGCGKGYWTCDGRNEGGTERHKPRTCDKNIKYQYSHHGRIYSRPCEQSFRNCTNPSYLHNQYLSGTWLEFSTKHAEKGSDEDDEDDQQASEETVENPTETPLIVEETDNSPDCDSCTMGGCSSCPITYACGVHSGHPGNASGHAPVSCGSTNANGDICTATGTYMCQTHTCVFPDPPANVCSRPGCRTTITASNESDHALIYCSGASHQACNEYYYACEPNASYDHALLECQRIDCPVFIINGWTYKIRRCRLENLHYSCVTINGVRRQHDVQ